MSNVSVTLEICRIKDCDHEVIFAKDFENLYESYTAIINFFDFYNSMLYDKKIKYRKPASCVVRDQLDKHGEWSETIGKGVHQYYIDLFLREDEAND